MSNARKVRPLVCLLLAVSTMIGAAVPARACGCTTPSRTPTTPASERVTSSIPAVKACCQPAAKKRSCCPSGSTCGTAKTSCSHKAPTERVGQPAPATDQAGCHCVRCDCGTPAAPPAPAAPAPFVPDADEHAASPVPPVLISGPPTASARITYSTSASPPTDLVISLSRLTC